MVRVRVRVRVQDRVKVTVRDRERVRVRVRVRTTGEPISFLIVSSSRKGSMAQLNMCLQCLEPKGRGWAMFHHAKHCRGRSDKPNNFAQAGQQAEANECHTDEHTDQQLTEVDAPVDDARQDRKRRRLELRDCTDLHLVGGQPSKRKSPVSIGPITREILEFLGTAEMGEGCSREHAQAWLKYHKKKGGVTSKFLPKDIRTCWNHVAEVKFIQAVVAFHT